jgi:hypothetical protein
MSEQHMGNLRSDGPLDEDGVDPTGGRRLEQQELADEDAAGHIATTDVRKAEAPGPHVPQHEDERVD